MNFLIFISEIGPELGGSTEEFGEGNLQECISTKNMIIFEIRLTIKQAGHICPFHYSKPHINVKLID